jgi:hypothetical protein
MELWAVTADKMVCSWGETLETERWLDRCCIPYHPLPTGQESQALTFDWDRQRQLTEMKAMSFCVNSRQVRQDRMHSLQHRYSVSSFQTGCFDFVEFL